MHICACNGGGEREERGETSWTQGQWHTGSTHEMCALGGLQRTVEGGEHLRSLPSFSINIPCISSAHLHSQLQPLGTRQHVPLSSDLTEGKPSPSPLPLTAVLGPGWSLSNIHTPLQCPEGWARLKRGSHFLHLWTQDCCTVPLSPTPVPSWGGCPAPMAGISLSLRTAGSTWQLLPGPC